jgi:Flp pilus assembly protein TadD
LLKGLRAIDDETVIVSALPPADTRVRVRSTPPRGLAMNKLSDAERSLIDLVGDGSEIGQVLSRSALGRSAASRSCFILLSLGLLEPIPEPVVEAEPLEAVDLEDAIEPCRDLILAQFEKLPVVGERDLLGIRSDAGIEAAREAYESLSSEWSEVRRQTRNQDLVDKVVAIELQLATAFARVRLEIENGAAPKPAPAPQDFARRDRVEQLARDARLHVQVRDWAGAIPLLHELVALEPHRAEFQALLGKSMQHMPTMRKNAEQHLLEAASLAPNDLSIRLELARFYLNASNRSRARAEIQSVLAVDPGNAAAQRLAASLREPTPMQKLLNKVFR